MSDILALIDGAIEDWQTSDDAMRWTPETATDVTVYPPATGATSPATTRVWFGDTEITDWVRDSMARMDTVVLGAPALGVPPEYSVSNHGWGTAADIGDETGFLTPHTLRAGLLGGPIRMTMSLDRILLGQISRAFGIPRRLLTTPRHPRIRRIRHQYRQRQLARRRRR